MLDYLRENFSSIDNQIILDEVGRTTDETLMKDIEVEPLKVLEVGWFEQLVRLYALLHDVMHIPFGHTVEDQAGLLKRHDEDFARINYVFAKVGLEVSNTPHFLFDGAENESLRRATLRLLDACRHILLVGGTLSHDQSETVRGEEDEGWKSLQAEVNEAMLKPYLLAYDIISNTICADLLDYSQRDSLHCSMPKGFDKAVLSSLKLVRKDSTLTWPFDRTLKDSPRLGVAVTRRKLRHDVITAIMDLLHTRYDLSEKVYYHHAKCAADAMLEKLLRSMPGAITWQELYDSYVGDEGMLILIEERAKVQPNSQGINPSQISGHLRSRRFYKAVFRITRETEMTTRAQEMKELARSPDGRTEIEKRICKSLRLNDGSVIVSSLPEKMQWKIARALVEWVDGQIIPLNELPDKQKYAPEIRDLTNRYLDLWSLTVYIHPDCLQYLPTLERVCVHEIFQCGNDPTLAPYLRKKWPTLFKPDHVLHTVFDEVRGDVSKKLATDLSADPEKTTRLLLKAKTDTFQNSDDETQELFPETGMRLAARASSSAPKVTNDDHRFTARLKHQLKDREVYDGLLGRYAVGEPGKASFEILLVFFKQNDLGAFADRAEFLRFLRRTLELHKYKASKTLNADQLTQWFRDFNAGMSDGSKL
jgi:HD superfamily phosphohydrolase